MPRKAATAPAQPLPEGRKRRSAPTTEQAIANARAITKGVKVGRPLTYHPRLCDEAIRLGSLGKSWAGIAAAFGISRSTLNEWESGFPQFSDALSRARAAAQAWWEAHGQRNLKAKHYQAQVSRNIMAAQFEDYREVAKGSNGNGLDLAGLVASIAQGVATATLEASQPGDGAKVIEATPVRPDKDDATR